jgi:hypothetical protein
LTIIEGIVKKTFNSLAKVQPFLVLIYFKKKIIQNDAISAIFYAAIDEENWCTAISIASELVEWHCNGNDLWLAYSSSDFVHYRISAQKGGYLLEKVD